MNLTHVQKTILRINGQKATVVNCLTGASAVNHFDILLTTKPPNCDSISAVGAYYDIDLSKSLSLEEHTKHDMSTGPSKAYDIQETLPIPE